MKRVLALEKSEMLAATGTVVIQPTAFCNINCTYCYLPDRNSPERETWYINMGAVDREFFTTNAMVRAAQ